MARTYIQVIKDDLTGDIVEDGQVETIEFAVGSKSYTIDLNKKNAADFHAALDKYVSVATRVSAAAKAARKGGNARPEKEQLAAIRSWAQQNGYNIAARGRISTEILDAYNNK